jgi:hypothetical protein
MPYFAASSRRIGAELQALDTLVVGVAHPLAGVRGCADIPVLPLLAAARTLVGDDARRDDLVAPGPLALGEIPLEASGRYATDRGDAVGEPQLVGVFGFRSLRHATSVDVGVDDARHDVPTRGVDLVVAGLGPILGVFHRQTRGARTFDLLDPVALDDDVDRTQRRRTGAVDHRHAADDQAVERTDPFFRTSVRCRDHRWFFFGCLFLFRTLRLLCPLRECQQRYSAHQPARQHDNDDQTQRNIFTDKIHKGSHQIPPPSS